MSRKAVHAVTALILVICLVCPYVETAVGWDGNIFVTGHDSETTLAIVVLLLELVVALASVLALLLLFLPYAQVNGHIAEESSRLTHESGFRFIRPDASPPVPLRI